ncbi:MAG TPA: penicillin-binding protein 2 [Thermodesulfobacteriota bacterium]|jgi:penicillin-binding protein 2|nr:penicillin-binding protein 2 [Thermodesulfobacteriota bacterium]
MMELNTQKMEDFKGRYKYFVAFVGLAFFLIFVRLWSLHVIKGSELRQLSENNRIRLLENSADRGMLLDRKGHVLAHNRPSFEVYLVPEDVRANPGVLIKIAELLNMPQDEIEEKIRAQRRGAPFRPVKIKSDINWNELAVLESNRVHLPGLLVDVRPRRAYDYGDLASHLIGYLGEVDENELKQSKDLPYRMGSLIGKYGVENRWENDLRGADGGRQIEVDALGREVRPLGVVEPFPGNNLFLTIDLDLQKTAEEAYKDKNGALIAMDPKTGHILAMVSKPSFEPFARNVSPDEWKALVENPYHPLTNKGIQGQYPAGSVFKIITAIAGLESGIITPNTQFRCTGAFPFGNRDFRCWKQGGHGSLSLHRAIVESCDIYFYQAGLKVGVDLIAHYAEAFGLGKLTGISLPHEKAGTVPSSSWKKKRFGVPWYSGETLSFSVGQGYLLTTPLQLLLLISGVANGGKLPLPQVVEKVEDVYGNTLKEYPPVELGRANVSQKTLEIIQEALKGAINEPHGTGSACLLKEVKVAGKTGTAQVVAMPEDFKRGEMNRIPLKFRDHAWFVAYAPVEDPKISVVVLVEHGGFGASAAAPIAKKVIEQYLNLNPSAPQKMAGEESDLEYAD